MTRDEIIAALMQTGWKLAVQNFGVSNILGKTQKGHVDFGYALTGPSQRVDMEVMSQLVKDNIVAPDSSGDYVLTYEARIAYQKTYEEKPT